jgi:ABC-type polysaccharide/polyol phosphate transport system ATPase subunit
MAQDTAISINNLHKDFLLPHERKSSLKEWVLHFKKPTFEHMHALKDINVEVKRGEFFGIVGRNGSGKSTLLKIIGGIYQPTHGSVQVNGTLTPFIELGIGFNPELTGRENVFLNGAILGLTRKEVGEKYDEIVAFSELERFMDQKLKNYSSGMQVRLAFSIAIQAHNDILLIDEVLAVGDSAFQRKCFNVFKDIKKQGKTVVFVTHDMGAVQEFCDRAMLISDGVVAAIGKSGKVARAYNELNLAAIEESSPDKELSKRKSGERPIEITKTYTILDDSKKRIFKPGERCQIVMECLANEKIENPIFGITIKDLTGRPLIVTNTKVKKINTGAVTSGEKLKVVFDMENVLSDGTYSISPAVADDDGKVFYDWVEDACTFDIGGWEFPAALIQVDHNINVHRIK